MSVEKELLQSLRLTFLDKKVSSHRSYNAYFDGFAKHPHTTFLEIFTHSFKIINLTASELNHDHQTFFVEDESCKKSW